MNMRGDVKRSNYPEGAIKAFTCGDCGRLAIAIAALTGAQIVVIANNESVLEWWHAAVRLENGHILDIEGEWSESAWLRRWQNSVAASYVDFSVMNIHPVDDDEFFSENDWVSFYDYPANEWATRVVKDFIPLLGETW